MRQHLNRTEQDFADNAIAMRRTGRTMEPESGNARCIFRAATWLFALAVAAAAGALAQTYGNPQISCPLGGTTSISGSVYAPNGTDPLPNILVYVPLSAPSAFTDGPANDTSSSLVTGTPVVETTTADDGTFTLTNMPVGNNVPLVIQAGRWRRQLIITTVTGCVNTVISSSTLVGGATSRFPQTQLEGDIPKMALVTAKADALECTLRKMGIADSEFTDYTVNASGASAPGRISLFEGAGDSGAKAGSTTHTEANLVGSASATYSGSLLGSYNVLLLPCQGDSNDYTTEDGRTNAITFADDGGRIFATHHSAFYIDQDSPTDTAATWHTESTPSAASTINTGFTSGSTLATWLQDLGATSTRGQITLSNVFLDQSGVTAPTVAWVTGNSADGSVATPVMEFSFYMPVGASAADQFGRAMYNEYHVDNTSTSSSVTFPAECNNGSYPTLAKTYAMDAQEHMLEYSLFDLMNFSVPVIVPTATIDITHSPSTFTGGDRADTITFNVTNTSESSSIATSPTVTLAISLPAGLAAVAINDPTNGWSCTLSTLTCTLATALAAGSSDAVIVTVAVAANVSEGSPSVSATVSSPGFSSSVVSPITLAVAAAPADTVTGSASASFADTNVASTASAIVTFAISAGTTIGSIAVVTQGATGLDFTNAGTGTCAAQSYESAVTCTVNVNFNPTYPGLRLGAVLLEDGDGNIQATTYLSGLGIGPQIAFSQPTVTSPVTGLNQPFGIAFDGLGNIFESDYGSGTIKKFTAASGYSTASTVATGISSAAGMAVDGAGNLFFSSYSGGAVYESALLSTGSYAAPQSVGSGFHSPFGTAVDASGNVFVADRFLDKVFEITAASGYTTTTSIGSGFNNPYSVALDLSGNVYVANGGNFTLVEITAASGYTTTNTLKTITGIQSATVDANGNVYISVRNSSTGGVFEILASSGSISSGSAEETLVSDLVLGPEIVAVAPSGNVFYGTSGGTAISKLDYADAPSLSYSSTTVSSSSSPQSVTVENIGNGNLTFGAGGLSAPTDFIQVAGGGAPPDCAGSGTVAANATCNLSIEFHPTTTGSLSGSFVLTDNSLNTEAGTQSIPLSGTGAAAAPITISPTTLPAGTVYSAYSQLLTASGGTGPYTYSVTGLPAGLSLATSTGRLSGSASEVGVYPLTATATDSTDATGSQDYTLIIGQATPTINLANLPENAIYGGSFTPSITYTGDGTASVASNSTGICTVSGGVVHFIAAGVCSLTASATAGTNYTAVSDTATFTIGRLTPTIAIANIPSSAIYGGSFTPSITYNGDGTSSVASNSNSICTVVSGVVHYVGVGTCSLTASATAGTNYASITGTAQSFTVSPASATVTLGNLAQNYTGTPLAVTATTLPTGLTVIFTYTGSNGTAYGPSSTPPTNGGSYTVVATVSDADYSGSATGTLVIVASLNLNFSVSGLAFGSVPVGFTSPTLTVILTNTNGSPVTITGIAASGDFGASSSCPTIAPSGTCSVNVTFAPSATGARTGTLTVSSAESNSPATIPLTGTGTQAGIQVTPVLLNFGSQAVASASTGQNITILNTGTASLLLSNVTTTGDFSTTGSCATIPAGSNCNLTVVFTPTATGARAGTVTFTDNVGNGNQTQLVNLTGAGTVAGAQMTPSALAFPSTVVGTTSFVLNTTLTNTGTAALTGIRVTTLGDFNQTNTCAATLAAAATCIVSVKYAPSVAGAETGTLVVTDNLGTQSVSLTGTGLTPGASLNTAQLVFGGQLVNTSSTAQTIVFTNTGTAAAAIASVAPTANFSDTTNCTGSIAPGASCSVNVVFAPTTTGSLSGTVTITDTAGSQVVTVQGLGVSRGLAVTPSFEIFGAQVVGTISQAQTLTAQNTGTTTLTLKPIVVSSNFTESDECSAALAPGATCSISLSFSPTSTGALAGSLVVSDTAGAVTTLVTLSGQGALPGINASPSTISFGSLPVHTTSQAQTVTVSNTGSAPLQIGSVSGTGDFAETDNCAEKTIAPGSYCVLNVTMTPSTTGTRTGTIQIDDNADGAHLIALSGVGQQAGVSISPTSLAFGSLPIVSSAQAASAAGTPLSVTITNAGTGSLTLGGFSTQGDFRENNNCGSTIAPGAVCTLTVTFVPTALGHRTGMLTITDNAGGGAQSVSLAGDGSPGGLTISPPVLNYGVQTVGVTSQPQQAIVTNDTGDAIDNLVIAASGEYGQTNNCGSTLANGASCTLQITVTPVTQGAITGTVTVAGALVAVDSSAAALNLTGIRNDATGSGSALSLGVVAVSASALPPGIGLSIPQLGFSVTAVGSPSSGQTVTLTNTGTAASLTGLTISGTNIAEFPFTTTCTATLAAQASCTITIHFTPTQLGLRVGTLNIAANGGIFAPIPESGNAVTDFTISPVNASSGGASQNILPGGTANYAIAIVPTLGTSFLTPTVLSISGQPAGAVASVGTEPWTQLTSTSWQLPANTTLQNLALSFSVPALSASAAREHTTLRTVLPILWGILLLPFAARLRRTGKRLARMLSLLFVASAGVAALATLSGCGANNGFFGQPQQSYTITVTATTGTLTHATQVTLTVQ